MENTGKKESYFLTAYLCNQFTPVRPLPDRGFLSCGACGTCGVWQNRERRLSCLRCLGCGPCRGIKRAFCGQKAEKFHIKDAFCVFHGTLDSRKSTSWQKNSKMFHQQQLSKNLWTHGNSKSHGRPATQKSMDAQQRELEK